MANVKHRKAPKTNTKSNPSKGKTKRQATETVKEPISRVIQAKKNESKKILTSDEKVALLLQNGHLMKDKFIKKVPLNQGKVDKNSLTIHKQTLLSKSGRIMKKTKDKLMLLDNILKSELMIEDNSSKQKAKPQSPPNYLGVDNNNDDGLSDQNKSESDKSTDCMPATQSPKKQKVSKNNSHKLSKKSNALAKLVKNKKKSESVTDKKTKTKQVTLSNGLVLTLSLFQCDYCQRTFSNKSSLRRHIYVHLDIKPYACTICSKRFRQRCNLQGHMSKKHSKDLTYVCNQCDKPFLLQENLMLHLANHVKNENSFRCVFCGKRFSHHLLLTEHEKKHLVSGRFQCSLCSMSYDCRSRLSLHVKSHLNIKDYVCQHCGKEFLRPNSIRRHVEVYHGGQRIQCPICKKMLKGHMTEHMRTHENKRPYQCAECGRRFTQSTQLTVHKRSHSGARPYPCRICRQTFTNTNALMLHIRRHTGEKPFSCVMCPLTFAQLAHMKAHMRTIHGKDGTYRCDNCHEFFKLKTQLEGHKKACVATAAELSFEEQIQASVRAPEVEPVMGLSRMRFLLALLLTMIATEKKLKCLGFNKRLIDDLLIQSLEAMGHKPCKDDTLTPLARLKSNIQTLLNVTVPEEQMSAFRQENKSTEELLTLLTDEKKG